MDPIAQRAKQVFLELAGSVPAEEWEKRLDEQCAGNSALRQRVWALLCAHADPRSCLDQPFIDITLDADTSEEIADRTGTQIGPYKLLQQIGEGGMGVVYMAEQKEPVERRVALKIIKPGMDTGQVIARFEAERQALSLMDHPNIARDLDAGTTDSGRPYFVMELVKGQAITQYCDEKLLTPRQRVELLLPVCQAIQHAHQKGIIHRDIKPTNILVAEYDQQPLPKVIDFGVAKAISQPLTKQTMFTGLGQIVGTLEYMSPEQAELASQDIDTRTDIYALGVLLYELLTGSTPFDKQRLRSVGWEEILRIIHEEEPPKPSTRLENSHQVTRNEPGSVTPTKCVGAPVTTTLASIAAVRGTEPARLTKLVRGELDWIVMKALEKDRARRYQTASALAADLQNYLNDEPVVACPPSAAYRFAKFARRNNGRLSAASVLAVSLLVAVSGIGWAVRDRSARQAEEKRERSERQARVITHLELILADVDRLMKGQKWDEALAFARRAEAALTGGDVDGTTRIKIANRLKDLEFVARLEQIRMSCASTVDGEFNYSGSLRNYRQAFQEFGIDLEAEGVPEEVIRRLTAGDGIGVPVAAALDDWVAMHRYPLGLENPGWQPLVNLACQLDPDPVRDWLRGTWAQSVTPELQAELQKLAESDDLGRQPPVTLLVLAQSLARANLADLQERILRHAQGQYPSDFWVNFVLGYRLDDAKLFDEASKCFSMALAVKPTSAAAHNNVGYSLSKVKKDDEAIVCYRKAIQLDPTFVRAHTNLGVALDNQGKLDEAIACHSRAIELDPTYAQAHNNLGVALKAQGKLDEAIVCYHKAIELDPKLAEAHNNLGVVLHRQKKLDEALASYRKAIELHPKYALAHSNLGFALQVQKMLDEAIVCCRRAIEFDAKLAPAHYNLGNALRDKGKLDEAIVCYGKAIELDPKLAQAYNNLGLALCDQGKLDEAVACYLKTIELDPTYAQAYNNLGLALCDQGRLDEAVACYHKAIELDSKLAQAHNNLGLALCDQGRLDEAVACYCKAIELDPKYALAHSNLGNALHRQKKLNEALASYRNAIELDPKFALAHSNLGNALHRQKKLDEAIASYRKAIELDPKHAPTHFILGNALREQGKLDEAIACYLIAIELKPKNAPAYSNLGDALRDRGRLDEAIACHRKAIELNPKDAIAHYNLSIDLRDNGQLDEAIAACRKAIELDPKFVGSHVTLGFALAKLGKLDEAMVYYRKAIELDPIDARAHTYLGGALKVQGKLDEAVACYRMAVELDPKNSLALNNLAWFLTTTNDPRFRNPKEGLVLARRAVAINPDWNHVDTLSEAAFRCGQWQESLDARLKLLTLRPPGPKEKYFLAMTHWYLGNEDESNKWYAEATAEFEDDHQKHASMTGIKQEADAFFAKPPGTPQN
jgi:tetratricopeptide (TPR) repeat protein